MTPNEELLRRKCPICEEEFTGEQRDHTLTSARHKLVVFSLLGGIANDRSVRELRARLEKEKKG